MRGVRGFIMVGRVVASCLEGKGRHHTSDTGVESL